MHILDTLERPIIFAHRGASKYAPENTMAAFYLAVKHGVSAIELDVMLTRDRFPVVIHDHLLDRTTNGTGRVDAHFLESIINLDAGNHFSPEFSGERIPLLNQVLEAFPQNVLINIELKNYHAPKDALVENVIEVVRKNGMESFVLFSSFLPRNLIKVRQLLPNARVALLCSQGFFSSFYRSKWYFQYSPGCIHPHVSNVNKAYLQKEHRRNRRVHVWTVNDPIQIEELISWGVDGIITDDTITAKRISSEILNNR